MAPRLSISLSLLISLPLLALALLPCAARATFPGQNGRIQFTRAVDAAGGAGHIYSIDPNGHNERQLTFGLNALDEDGSWSPDGARIVFERCSDPSFSSCGIVVMNADGSGGQTLTPIDAGIVDDYPVFSPDGSKIAFSRGSSSSCCELTVMNADGSGVHSIRPMQNSYLDGPSWSPDGTRLAYIDTSGSVAVTNADGNGTPLILHTPTGGYDHATDWSPDGSRIIFGSAGTNASGYNRIWSVPSDGSAPAIELAPSDAGVIDDEPSFSPDGTKILFERYETGSENEPIYMANADGSGAVRVTGEEGYTYRATWQPLHPAPAPPPPPAPHPPFAGISLITHAVTASSTGVALISQSCPAATNGSCTGTLTLKTAGPVAASTAKKRHKVKRRIVTLGRGSFSIPAGKTAKVRVRLTKTALKILLSNRKLRVLATVVSHDASGAAQTTSAKLTLRAPSARKKRRSHG